MRHLLLFIGLALSITLGAQTILDYSTHAIKAGTTNPMSFCEYLDPGAAGSDITWDFSELKKTKELDAVISSALASENFSDFSNSNVELQEFKNNFYLEVDNTGMRMVGYKSACNCSKIKYTTPFEKMRYPFKYNDSYSGTLAGDYYNDDTKNGSMSGTYSVEADATGTILLPGNVSYDNTLRVKTTRNYTREFTGATQDVEINTYRWYINEHRYPLLVLTEIKSEVDGRSSVKYQAAYNNEVIETNLPNNVSLASSDLTLYPNPSSGNLSVKINSTLAGDVTMNIIDVSGKLVSQIDKKSIKRGENLIDLSTYVSDLSPGSYILMINQSGENISKEFSLVE